MTSIRILTVLIGGLTLIWTGIWPSTPASAQVLERGVQGAAVGAIIGGIVGGGRGAGTGAAIGAGVGVLSGAAEANARAHGYYGPPPPGYYGPPPARYYGPPPIAITVRRLPHVPRSAYPSVSLRRLFQFTSSRFVQAPATYGRQATGPTVRMDIIGYLEPGCCRPLSG